MSIPTDEAYRVQVPRDRQTHVNDPNSTLCKCKKPHLHSIEYIYPSAVVARRARFDSGSLRRPVCLHSSRTHSHHTYNTQPYSHGVLNKNNKCDTNFREHTGRGWLPVVSLPQLSPQNPHTYNYKHLQANTTTEAMEQFSHDLTVALEETSKSGGVRTACWGVRRRTRSTGNLRTYMVAKHAILALCVCVLPSVLLMMHNYIRYPFPFSSMRPTAHRGQFQQSGRWYQQRSSPSRRRRRPSSRNNRRRRHPQRQRRPSPVSAAVAHSIAAIVPVRQLRIGLAERDDVQSGAAKCASQAQIQAHGRRVRDNAIDAGHHGHVGHNGNDADVND